MKCNPKLCVHAIINCFRNWILRGKSHYELRTLVRVCHEYQLYSLSVCELCPLIVCEYTKCEDSPNRRKWILLYGWCLPYGWNLPYGWIVPCGWKLPCGWEVTEKQMTEIMWIANNGTVEITDEQLKLINEFY